MFKENVNGVHGATAARHAMLRTRLVDVADATIAAGGLGDIKARELARQAGCAVGAIYTVFTDIDELILEVSARTLKALDAHLQEAASRHPDADPPALLVVLAEAYLDYAVANRRRWDALFTHRLPLGRTAPDWLSQLQADLFARVEGPVAALWPELSRSARTLLARTVFSAVHGVVTLGLDQRVATIDTKGLREQLRLAVTALAAGLSHKPRPIPPRIAPRGARRGMKQ
ncbi:MAG TPA: TetR-like C-terminal domain-containing protein [Acidisphaera sp.]|nr:TetR-like C-terminal domain-containing protein [Acidisphaera sp.]